MAKGPPHAWGAFGHVDSDGSRSQSLGKLSRPSTEPVPPSGLGPCADLTPNGSQAEVRVRSSKSRPRLGGGGIRLDVVSRRAGMRTGTWAGAGGR